MRIGGGGASDSGVVSVDARDLRTLGGTAHSASNAVGDVITAAGGIVGGLDGRGWDIGAVQARWVSVRGQLTRLATDLGTQAIDLQVRALWVESFENGGNFGNVPAYALQDPVNSANGNLIHVERDLHLPTRGEVALAIERTYNSRDDSVGVFGRGWTSILDFRVEDCGDIGAVVRRPTGRRDAYARNDSGAFDPPMGVRDSLERQRSGWRLTGADGTLTEFGPSGRAQLIQDRNGNQVCLERDAFNRVVRFTDATGRGFTFEYQGDFVSVAKDTAGRQARYAHAGQCLIETIAPELGAMRYAYDVSGRIESIADALGRQTLRNTYDGLGRVVEQRNAKGAVSRFSYAGDDAISLTTSLTDPRGGTIRLEHDERGLVTRIVDALGQSVTFTYTECGNRASQLDRAGQMWVYEYNSQCRLSSTTDPTGATASFAYTEAGDLAARTDALGNTWRYAYDQRRNLTSITSPLGGVRRFEYASCGQLVREVDPDGVETRYAHDDAGQVILAQTSAGDFHFEYDAVGRLVTATDSNAACTTWEYDAAGRPTLMRNALGHTSRWEFDAAGQLAAETDATGARTVFGYDAAGYVVSFVNALGGRRLFEYDSNGNVVAYTDGSGATSRFNYDRLDRVVDVVNPSGGAWSVAYDPNGNRVAATDARGATARNVLDAAGRPIEHVDRAGGRHRYALDALGRVICATDPNGASTTFTYDADGRPTRRTDALGGELHLVWTPAGRLARALDGSANALELGYDQAGRVVRVRYPDHGEAHLSYDAIGNLAGWTEPSGATTRLGYNALRQLVTQTDPLGNMLEVGYDPRGAIASLCGAGATTQFQYDPLGRLTQVVDALSNRTRYAYDGRGLLTGIVDASGNAQTFGYDGTGRLIESVDALGRKTRFARDPNGNCVAREDAAGNRVQMHFDAADRPVRLLTDADEVEVTYDAAGNWTAVRGGVGTQKRVYDAVGRVVQATNPSGAVIQYTYDADGRLTSLTYPDGQKVALGYDAAGRIVEERDDRLGTLRMSYGADGRLVSTELPGGIKRAYERDLRGRITRLCETDASGEALNTYGYTYDEHDQIVAAEENGRRTAYAYDALGRLIAAGETHFAYDAGGNRTCVGQPDGQQIEAVYDAADQLLSLRVRDGDIRFSYDIRGNLVERVSADGRRVTYTWDALDRLIRVDAPDASREYAYDGLGELYRERRDGKDQHFTFDTTGGLSRLLAAGPNRFLYGSNRVASVVDGPNGVDVPSTDVRGSVRASDYDVWGQPLSESDSILGFTGELQDNATGLVYLRARWYDPTTGRMLGRDPFGGLLTRPLSLNPYVYAEDNPVSLVDPSGLSASSTLPLPAGAFPGAWPFGRPPIPGLPGMPSINGVPELPDINLFGSEVWPPAPGDITMPLFGLASAAIKGRLAHLNSIYEATRVLLKGHVTDWSRAMNDLDRFALGTYEHAAARGLADDSEAAIARTLRRIESLKGDAGALKYLDKLKLPVAGAGIDTVTSGLDQYGKDGKYPEPQRIARAAVTGAINAGFQGGGAAVGGALCSPADLTGVGVVLDAACATGGAYAGKVIAAPFAWGGRKIVDGVSSLIGDL